MFYINFCYFHTPAYAQKPPFNMHADKSDGVIGLNFGLSLYLHPYFVFANIEGSRETVEAHLSLHC